MVEKGVPWERPASGPPEWTVTGDDVALAAAVRDHHGVRLAFEATPASDLARALGMSGTLPDAPRTLEVSVDALRVDADGRDLFAVNMVVLGTPPDRMGWFSGRLSVTVGVDTRTVHTGTATAVVIANGQHLRGADVVPRGHPGDGRAEVQVYTPRRGEARQMRARLVQGAHLPHPRIMQVVGRRIEVRAVRPMPLEVDGVQVTPAARVTVEVVPEAFSLLI
jgi:YegS C-terminal NAD kinase beta sandwich-like domain